DPPVCAPWLLYTAATATAAAYKAALARIFGTDAGETRDDQARNGSRPDHPLHPLYAVKTKAKYMGDGVLIYFGYPHAHEDDAEQAVRAALAVIEVVSRLPTREDLRVRLGIATGLAVVGD